MGGLLGAPSHVRIYHPFFLVIFLYALTNVLSESFKTIIALEKLFNWGTEQVAMYCGRILAT